MGNKNSTARKRKLEHKKARASAQKDFEYFKKKSTSVINDLPEGEKRGRVVVVMYDTLCRHWIPTYNPEG